MKYKIRNPYNTFFRNIVESIVRNSIITIIVTFLITSSFAYGHSTTNKDITVHPHHKTRVVVTRVDNKGRSYIYSDKMEDGWTIPTLPGYKLTDLFFTKNTPYDIRRESAKLGGIHGFHLKPGQIRFISGEAYPSKDAYKSMKKKNRPKAFNDYGYHSTPTIDFLTVTKKGTIVMRIGKNQKVTLKEGDTIVQRGTKHTIWNLTNKVARYTAVLVGVKQKEGTHNIESFKAPSH